MLDHFYDSLMRSYDRGKRQHALNMLVRAYEARLSDPAVEDTQARALASKLATLLDVFNDHAMTVRAVTNLPSHLHPAMVLQNHER